MGSSSFLNAFRLIFKRPALILLLLPLQLATPLVSKLMVASGPIAQNYMSDYSATEMTNEILSVWSQIFNAYLIIFLLVLLAGFFLIPQAMELLHAGAKGEDAPAGWYGRGMKKHWWKPVSIGAIEVGIFVAVCIFFYIILFVLMFAAMPSLMGLSELESGDVPSSMIGVFIMMLVMILVIVLVIELIMSFFAMMLPATADRSFGEAFRVLFSKLGFKKVLKVWGVYLLTGVVSMLVVVVFMVGYVLLSGRISSYNDFMTAVGSYSETWTSYFAGALASLIMLFKYGYIFSVFQEIKNKEQEAESPVLPPVESIQ